MPKKIYKIKLQTFLQSVQDNTRDHINMSELMDFIHEDALLKQLSDSVTVSTKNKDIYANPITQEQIDCILGIFQNQTAYFTVQEQDILLAHNQGEKPLSNNIVKEIASYFEPITTTQIADKNLSTLFCINMISLLLLSFVRKRTIKYNLLQTEPNIALNIDEPQKALLSQYFNASQTESFVSFGAKLLSPEVVKKASRLSGNFFDDLRKSSAQLTASKNEPNDASQTIHRYWQNDAFLFDTCRRVLMESIKNSTNRDRNPRILKRLRHQFQINYGINYQFNVAAAYLFYYWSANVEQPNLSPVDVLDTSHGWGDRGVAAYFTPNIKSYTGIDPNYALKIPFDKMQQHLYTTAPNGPQLELISQCAEDYLQDQHKRYQIAFTCPPYYTLEKYSSDETQSIKKYPKYSEWRLNFLYKLMELTWRAIDHNGIIGIVIKNIKDYPIADDVLALFKGWKDTNRVSYLKEYDFQQARLVFTKNSSNHTAEKLFIVKINTFGAPIPPLPPPTHEPVIVVSKNTQPVYRVHHAAKKIDTKDKKLPTQKKTWQVKMMLSNPLYTLFSTKLEPLPPSPFEHDEPQERQLKKRGRMSSSIQNEVISNLNRFFSEPSLKKRYMLIHAPQDNDDTAHQTVSIQPILHHRARSF